MTSCVVQMQVEDEAAGQERRDLLLADQARLGASSTGAGPLTASTAGFDIDSFLFQRDKTNQPKAPNEVKKACSILLLSGCLPSESVCADLHVAASHSLICFRLRVCGAQCLPHNACIVQR